MARLVRPALGRVFIAAILIYGSVLTAHASATLDRALTLAESQQFDAALAVLDSADAAQKSEFDYRFTRARILSWGGYYDQSETELASLSADYPKNADVELVRGNLDFYRGDYDAAQTHFQTVLAWAPDYTDGQLALDRLRKARKDNIISGGHAWRIDSGASLSSFSDPGRDDWRSAFIRIESQTQLVTYFARAEHFERFGTTDTELQLGLSSPRSSDWEWSAAVGMTPSADFRPGVSLSLSLGRIAFDNENMKLFVGANLRFDEFDSGTVTLLSPSATAYLPSGTAFTARLYHVDDPLSGQKTGWLGEVRQPVADRWTLKAGYAQAPETLTQGLTVDSQTLYGGVSYQLDSGQVLNFGLSKSDRDGGFSEQSLNFGITQKF